MKEIENPCIHLGPGRPSTSNQRNKSFVEIIAKKKKKGIKRKNPTSSESGDSGPKEPSHIGKKVKKNRK